MPAKPLTVMNLISDEGKGGADILALDISKGLKRRGHTAIFACPSDCFLNSAAHAAGLEVYHLDHSGSRDMTPLSAFMTFCKKERVDIVNVHHSHGRHMLIAAKLRGLGSKAVFTRHCIPGPNIAAIFYNFILDMNLAVSNTIKKSLIRSGIWQSKVTTVYGGINIEKFEKVPAEKIEDYRQRYARRGVFTIGMVARLGLAKGFRTDKPTMKRHEVLFRALAGLRDPFHLLLLGLHKDRDIDYMKVIAQDNGLDTEKITCCLFQDDVAPFYKIMDLNVLPSPAEGLGLAIIEAMASGVACIGADSGGIREVITNGTDGFLFKAGDSEDLAEKIGILRKDRELRESFILKGKEKVREKFDIEKTVLETERIFYHLMQK